MKEIGGYIEFEHYHGRPFHDNCIKLNCGRNCLAYLIKLYGIKCIYIPYFLCNSVFKICRKCGVEVQFYHIGEDFLPIIPDADFTKDWLYVVNYYGQLTNKIISELKFSAQNLIVDNVQAFFQEPVKEISTLYTCRKFFGVTDGAYLYSDIKLDEELDIDVSYNRMEFLLGRFEKSASEFYPQYVANNDMFENEPIKNMSALTDNLMHSFDYEHIKNTRTKNFAFFHKKFGKINKLKLFVPDGAFAYPLYIENGEAVRKELQKEKIYIPTLWPDVFEICKEDDLEYKYANNILPLPIDQRYDENIINHVFEGVLKCMKL